MLNHQTAAKRIMKIALVMDLIQKSAISDENQANQLVCFPSKNYVQIVQYVNMLMSVSFLVTKY